MKTILASATLVFAILSAPTQAAQLRVDSFGPGPDPGSEIFAVFLDGEELNGQFDTVIVDIATESGSRFLQLKPVDPTAFQVFEIGEGSTFIAHLLPAPVAFGGHGFSLLGQVLAENFVQFAGGPLGQTIDTVNGPNVGDDGLFLANILLQGGPATASAQLVRAGTIVADLRTTFGVPEPQSLTLLGCGVLGWMGSRRSKIGRSQ